MCSDSTTRGVPVSQTNLSATNSSSAAAAPGRPRLHRARARSLAFAAALAVDRTGPLPRRLPLADRGDPRRCDRRRAGARGPRQGATPGFDGARLDDIVDYLTFVFVPVLLLYRAGHLPDGLGSCGRRGRAAEQRVRLRLARREDRRLLFHRVSRRTGTSSRCICTPRGLPPAVNAAHPAGARARWCSCGSATSIRRARRCCAADDRARRRLGGDDAGHHLSAARRAAGRC